MRLVEAPYVGIGEQRSLDLQASARSGAVALDDLEPILRDGDVPADVVEEVEGLAELKNPGHEVLPTRDLLAGDRCACLRVGLVLDRRAVSLRPVTRPSRPVPRSIGVQRFPRAKLSTGHERLVPMRRTAPAMKGSLEPVAQSKISATSINI
jgi:hypothetical protein